MKKKTKLKRQYVLLFLAIIVGSFSIILGFYLQNKNVVPKNEKKEEGQETYTNILPSLREFYQNNDIIAQLEIPSLNFKELIVKGTDNDYYLTHDIQKNESNGGAIFLDYRTANIDQAKQINIYGHNSNDYDLPFGILEKYLDEDFFYNHKDLTLKTDQSSHSYQIFAVSTIDKGNNEHMYISYQNEKFLNHLISMRSNALFDTGESLSEKDDILVLQTCLFDPDQFLLILAKKMN